MNSIGNSIEDIANLGLLNPKGRSIKLNQFATVEETTGPTRVERFDRVSSVTVLSKVLGRPVGSIGGDINRWITENPPSAGVSFDFGGDLERQADSFIGSGLCFYRFYSFCLPDHGGFIQLLPLFRWWSCFRYRLQLWALCWPWL